MFEYVFRDPVLSSFITDNLIGLFYTEKCNFGVSQRLYGSSESVETTLCVWAWIHLLQLHTVMYIKHIPVVF